MSEDPKFWEDPTIVAQFAARKPDHRLRALIEAEANPERLRVLDVGCAGGRNAVFLAERGCEVHAVDLSSSMVEETRRRMAPLIGNDAVRNRVRQTRMEDLSMYENASFDLVIALGIYHQAASAAEWQRAVKESVRVLRPAGTLLVAHFAPGTDFTGTDGRPVEGQDDLYELQPGRHAVLFPAERLDALMREQGLVPEVPTETVSRPREEGGVRVTVNARYRRVE